MTLQHDKRSRGEQFGALSTVQLLDGYKSAEDLSVEFSMCDELATRLRAGTPESEAIHARLAEWLGSENPYGVQVSQKAFGVFHLALLHGSPHEQAAIARRLKVLTSDPEHPFRLGDAGYLTNLLPGSLEVREHLWLPQLENSDAHVRFAGLTALRREMAECQRHPNPGRASAIADMAAPALLSILNRADQQALGLDFFFAEEVFCIWASSNPAGAVAGMIEAAQSLSAEDGTLPLDGVILVTRRCFAGTVPDLAVRLFQYIGSDGHRTCLAQAALLSLDGSHTRSLLALFACELDQKKLLQLLYLIPWWGVKALNQVVDWMQEGGPQESRCGLALLGAFAGHVASSSDAERIDDAAKIRARLTEEGVGRLIETAQRSSDEHIVNLANLTRRAIAAL